MDNEEVASSNNPPSHRNQLSNVEISHHNDSISTDSLGVRRRVHRKYLSMVGSAFLLTISCPGSRLWSPDAVKRTSKSHLPTPNNQEPLSTRWSVKDSNKTSTFEGRVEHNMTNPNDKPLTLSHNNTLSFDDFSRKITSYYGPINIQHLAKLLSSIAILVLSFYAVLGSNPGWLDSNAMSRLECLEKSEPNGGSGTVSESIDWNDEGNGHIECRSPANNDINGEKELFLPTPLDNGNQTQQNFALEQPNKSTLNITTLPKLYSHTRRKECDKCQIHPPLRSHHCQICKKCVATFDHHCIFLGTCIGERNHFRFWFFVWMNVVTLSNALGIVNSGRVVVDHGQGNEQDPTAYWLKKVGHAILVVSKLYMYPIFLAASLLWVVHTVLAICNTTTFECGKGGEYIDYLRGTGMMDFPFSRGLFKNIAMFVSRDDSSLWIKNCKDWVSRRILLRCCGFFRIRAEQNNGWIPILWKMPGFIVRDSEEWWNHPWQNKYWSCC